MNDGTKKAKRKLRKGVVRRWITRIGLAVLGIGVIAAVVYGSLPKPVSVESAHVTRGNLTVTVDEDGRTRVKDRYVISAPLTGNLARIELQPGDRVEENAEIGRLLPLPSPLLDPQSRAQAQSRLAAAKAAYQQARSAQSKARSALKLIKKEVEKKKQLLSAGAITKQSMDIAELDLKTRQEDVASAGFGVRVAKNEVDVAEAALGRLDGKKVKDSAESIDQILILAPVEGVVLEVRQKSKGVVQAGTPLIEIGDPSALEIVIDILTTDAVRIEPGDSATIIRWGGGTPLNARVRRIEPKAFTRISSLGVEEQRVNVVLDLDTPQDEWAPLGDGYRVEASIVVWQAEDVLRVPASSVFRHDDQWAVFVLQGDVAKLRKVEIGERNGFEAEVLEGLSEDDIVILHPGERVKDGTKVQAP